MNEKHLLMEKIASLMEELKTMKIGSEEYKSTVATIKTFMDALAVLREIELKADKNQDDYELEKEKNQNERDSIENEKKDNVVKNVLNGLGIVATAGLTIWGTIKTIKFEETGTITTCAGRNFFNRLFKK